jgi:hypothetical protein
MPTYYVATMARYVLVEAENESQARERGRRALNEQYADLRERLGRNVPIEIRTIRLATEDEVELSKWHGQMVSREQQTMPS